MSKIKKEKTQESYYQQKLAQSIPDSQMEVRTDFGYIDVLTPDEVIEVKFVDQWKQAIGQILVYSSAYPDRGKRLHVITPNRGRSEFVEEVVKPACKEFGIRVTYEAQVDRRFFVYKIQGRDIRSLADARTEVKAIRDRTWFSDPRRKKELAPDDKAFILELVNAAPWSKDRFGGEVVDVRLKSHYADQVFSRMNRHYSFQVRSADAGWMSISIENYIKIIPSRFKPVEILYARNEPHFDHGFYERYKQAIAEKEKAETPRGFTLEDLENGLVQFDWDLEVPQEA